jgi:serine/threonine protein kinase/tetratricopeptide (TPR) repeat protein
LRVALRGHYEIEREIGTGAFATVYLARDLKHERKVALKVLHADPTSETGELRFIREIRLLARLQHPNILPLHDSGHVETLLYYVMPYVSGETLRERIDRLRQLPADTACNIAREVADALAYAHGQGIIHRDIKPENILLSTGHPILADFGIARVIDVAGVRQLTRTGTGSPGTPAYMSPEQLMGDKELDGRSDTYSLGCVLYEMLTGKPPFSGKAGFVKRFTEPPPSVSTVRHDLPSWIDGVVAKTLAKSPRDRYQTAQEFVDALCGPVGTGSPAENATRGVYEPTVEPRAHKSPDDVAALPAPAQHRWEGVSEKSLAPKAPGSAWLTKLSSRWATIAMMVAIALLALAFSVKLGGVQLPAVFGRASPDSSRFVILPFGPIDAGDSSNVGERVADRLYDAFSEWDGVPVVTDARVADAIKEKGAPPATESEALAMARRLGAGKLVWGQAGGSPGATRIRANLYDVASGESRDAFPALDTTLDARVYEPVALRLLGGRTRPAAAIGGDGLTRSFPAWSAYGRGHRALAEWQLDNAENEFRTATLADPRFAPASLWLAQVRALRSFGAKTAWEEPTRQALASTASLKARELALAQALASMASGNSVLACEKYREQLARDSLDYIAWNGLGYCTIADNLVVPDPHRRGGWEFRSGYSSAFRAFSTAIEIEPRLFSVLPFDTLLRVAPIQPGNLRLGFTTGRNRQPFAGYPSLVDDTLGYTPYPLADILSANPATFPRSVAVAAQHDREMLLKLVLRWIKTFPESPKAYESLAILQESRGEISSDRGDVPSALSAVRIARGFAVDAPMRTSLIVREVRLRLKHSEFERVRMLTDSVLVIAGSPAGPSSQLAGLAALTGRIGLTGRLVEPKSVLSGDRDPSAQLPSEDVLDAAIELYVTAALGVCGKDLDRLDARLNQLLESYATDDQRQQLRNDLTSQSWIMAFPCKPAFALRVVPARDRLLQMQQSVARGHLATARAQLDSVTGLRKNGLPGDVTPDYTFQEAWLLTSLADTAEAVRRLDLALSALPTLGNTIFELVPQAAGLVRAMILRADLANAQGDRSSAKKWASAVLILWANADAPLQPIVHRMQLLAR